MKRIKHRLLSLATACAMLLGTTLAEPFAASAKSKKESDVSEATASEKAAQKKSSKKQSQEKASGADEEAKASKSSKSTSEDSGKSAQAQEKEADAEKETKASKSSKSTREDSGKSEQAQEKEADAEKETKASKSSKSTSEDSGKSGQTQEKASSEEVRLTLSISKPSDLSQSGGVYQVDPDKVSALTLSWKCKGDCDSFKVTVSGGVYSMSTKKKSAAISVKDLPEGKYTATVKAIRDGKTVAREKLSFQIIAPSDREEAEKTGEEQSEVDAGITAEEQCVEKAQIVVEEQSADEAQSALELLTVDEIHSAVKVLTADEILSAMEVLTVDGGQTAPEERSAGAKQSAARDQSAEQAQSTAQDQSAEQAQSTAQDQSTEQAQSPAKEQTADEAQDTVDEQPFDAVRNTDADQPIVEVIDGVEAQSIEGPLPEVPDLQIPSSQEDPGLAAGDVLDQVVLDEVISDEVPDLPEDPDMLGAEPDVPLVLDDQTDTAEDSSDILALNASGEKDKSDAAVTLSILGMEGLAVIDGEVHIDPEKASAITLVWSFGGACDEYAVSVSGGVYDNTTKKAKKRLSIKDLPAGKYTVTVAAKKEGEVLSSARLSFQIDAAEPEGEDSRLIITVASPQGLLITDGAYQVDPTQAEALTLAWRFGGKCDGYDVSVSEDVYSGRTEESTLTLPLSGVGAGTYTVTVTATDGEDAVAQSQLTFVIPSEEKGTDEKEGQGEKPGGQRKAGGQKSGAAKGGDEEEDQGFHVTPGEALVSTHTSGNRDMRLYGAVALTLDDESAMNRLCLGGATLDIRLSDDGPFTAFIEEDALLLVPIGDAQGWLLNGYALKTLARSGISFVRLTLGDAVVDFPTQPQLTGKNYGALCAEGRVSRDYWYSVYSDGCSVTVANQTFQLTEEGELT